MIRNFIRAALVSLGFFAGPLSAESPFIVVQSTTSTQNSGLLDYILPGFEAETGIDVRVVAVGTGQAIRNAINGDGDVLLVHAKPAEEQFVADGWGVERLDVMYNDFILVGPKSDPANVKGEMDIVAALTAVSEAEAPFASRGDDSGTHKAEMRHWDASGVDPTDASGKWYRETGSGMGATLNVASGMEAYALTDRGTWQSFGNKGNLEVLVEGDPRLYNQYGVILVNPAKHPRVRAAAGQRFIEWLTGPDGQAAIASYKLDGEQLFFPNAD
ncbi:extracellular solute-binding protein [Ruegeria lacuscaerulensis]|uniref:extracellular solute-binding protein n=1 Tax=Ruegeria lacuscaerulensis TaxID=55218 RepID=UPI00147D4F29|nr:extracellular solute-binding protein [Ruegeria lacuscaerulensis]